MAADNSVVIFGHSFHPLLVLNEPRHEKTCSGFQPGTTQTGLLSPKRLARVFKFWLQQEEVWYYEAANNKGADQTARMRRLICTFVVRIGQKQVFSWCGSNLESDR